jgi:hypothetical protein
MRTWAMLAGLGSLLVIAPASPVLAQCENTGKTCLEAMRFHQRICARVGRSSERRACYSLGEDAFNTCTKTGKWITERCSLSGLPAR